MTQPIIELHDVTLKLRLHRLRGPKAPAEAAPKEPTDSHVGGRIERDFWGGHVVALEDLNLAIPEGERVAVIGHNGAGKTTFLRLLAGIYAPTSGHCIVRGHRSCVLSVGLGLYGEMTLVENIRFALTLYDLPFGEIEGMIPGILDFAELNDFADAPLHACSRGMKARLGFSIATSVAPDVLLVDEAISAGDAQFAKKAHARVEELFADSRALVLAAHSQNILKRFCTRAIWLEKGRLKAYGDLDEIWAAYSAASTETDAQTVSLIDDAMVAVD